MSSFWLSVSGISVIVMVFIVFSWLENNIEDAPKSLNFDFKDSFPIMKTLGIIGGVSLFVYGIFKKKP